MPVSTRTTFPMDKQSLLSYGTNRAAQFCNANNIEMPEVNHIPSQEWFVGACAYYRVNRIYICLEECARPASPAMSRVWSWPGNYIDRTPYGVVCHELGHHCDVLLGRQLGLGVGKYSSMAAKQLMQESGEAAITNYCPDPGEWFAEMFRVFITNPNLLAGMRPVTYKLFRKYWNPVTNLGWRRALGTNVPSRIVSAIEKRIVT